MRVCLRVNVWAQVCITLTLRLSRWSIIIATDEKDELWSLRGVRLDSPAKVNSGWRRTTDLQKLIFAALEGHLNHILFPPTFVCGLFGFRHWLQVQRGIFNKLIMKNKPVMQQHKSPAIAPVALLLPTFVKTHIVCCSSPTATSPPEAFIKDWHGRNGLSGTASLEALGSMDALWAHCHSKRHGNRRRRIRLITIVLIKHGIMWNKSKNKRLHPCSPLGRGCANSLCMSHRANTETHTCVHAGW